MAARPAAPLPIRRRGRNLSRFSRRTGPLRGNATRRVHTGETNRQLCWAETNMKQMIKSAFRAMGFEVRRIMPTQKRFTVAGINYDADPCSVGHEPQGELTGRGAVRIIRERGLKNLSILDMCCGVGVIGLTIFSELRSTDMLDKVALADINIFNINSLERTLKVNGLQALEIGRAHV